MSDRQILVIGLAIGALSLYINVRMAVALQKLNTDANKTVNDVKTGPLGPALAFLGVT